MSSSGITKPLLEVGTRISCYWRDDDEWYEGTVADHLGGDWFWIRYDNEDEGEMNLKEDKWRRSLHPEKSMQTKDMTHPSLNVTVELDAKKRKEDEFVDLDRPLKRRRPQNQQEAKVGESNNGDNHIEQVDLETGEIITTFPSLRKAEAATGIDRVAIKRVLDICGKANGGGYFWRYQGETHGPWPDLELTNLNKPKGSEEIILRVGRPVEQVDLVTGEIIEAFPSIKKAHETTKVRIDLIRPVLERRGKANGGGYFWRFQGETHGPWPDPTTKTFKPVEQLDLETGKVLACYESLSEAKRATGLSMSSTRIQDICNGKPGRRQAQGFFWRWKGSDSLPNPLTERNGLEIRKERNGKIVKVFRNQEDVQAFFGHQCCWSTLCRKCQTEGFYLGYYWQYQMPTSSMHLGAALIGKQLQVKQDNNSWLEGKITNFCSESGEHEIWFDCGIIERRSLEHIEFKWMLHRKKKPVEQLDLRTGQVLASFDSIAHAARSIANGHADAISAVCTGRAQSASGYFWRYKGSKRKSKKKYFPRKIDQLCLKTGRVIATFDKLSDAAAMVGVWKSGISKCCNSQNKKMSAGGFGWRFSKESDD